MVNMSLHGILQHKGIVRDHKILEMTTKGKKKFQKKSMTIRYLK